MIEHKQQCLIDYMRQEALFRSNRDKIYNDPKALLEYCKNDHFNITYEDTRLLELDFELSFEDPDSIEIYLSIHKWVDLKLLQIGKIFGFRNYQTSDLDEKIISKIRQEMHSIEYAEKECELWRRYALKHIFHHLKWTIKGTVGRKLKPWADAAKIIISSIQDKGGFYLENGEFIATHQSARNVINELLKHQIFKPSELGAYFKIQTDNQRSKGVEETLEEAIIRIEQWIYSKSNGAKDFTSSEGQRAINLVAMEAFIFNADGSLNPTSPELIKEILIS